MIFRSLKIIFFIPPASFFKSMCQEFKFNRIMNCQEFLSQVEKQDQGSLKVSPEMQAHLDQCPSCQAAMELEQEILNYSQYVHDIQLPDDFSDKVMARIEREKLTQSTFRIWISRSRKIAASLLILAILGMGVLVGRYSASMIHQANLNEEQVLLSQIELQYNEESYDLLTLSDQ